MPKYLVRVSQVRQLTKVFEAAGAAELSDLLIDDAGQVESTNGWDIDPYTVDEHIEKVMPVEEIEYDDFVEDEESIS